MVEVRWRGLETGSTERCTVDERAGGVRVEGVVETMGETYLYTLTADASWQFTSLRIRSGSRSLEVDYDGVRWLVDGVERPDLDAAREVDLAVSPLSNTLPIRRLELDIGGSADITTAYVSEDLGVVTDPQRYTRLAEHQYRYESRDSDFARTISVDGDGLVLDYPGLFVREGR